MLSTGLTSLQLISVRWWNGSAYYAVSLAKCLDNAGSRAYLGGRGDSPPIQKAVSWKLPCLTDVNLESQNPLIIKSNVNRLKRFVVEKKVTLLNAHRGEDLFHAVLLNRKLDRKLPIIRTASDVRPPKKHPLNRWMHETAIDYIIFSCQANLLRYQNVWPIFEGRSRVIHGGVDTDFFRPDAGRTDLKIRLSLPPESPVIGIIGRLSPTKGHDVFLKAAAEVAVREPKVRFVISGEPVEIGEKELRQQALKCGIADKLTFLAKQQDVRDVIQLTDIPVVASTGSEAVSRITMECMAMGRPQVVTNVNVLPELIDDGRNGLVVPPSAPRAMAEALLKLIRRPDTRQEMGETARKIAVEKFSYPVFAEKTLSVYQEVLKKHPG